MLKSIVHLPDKRLREKTQSIDFKVFKTKDLQVLIEDMFEIMYTAGGIGLAAPQIGLNYRLAVIDVKRDRSEQWILINPEILWETEKVERVEGCLSIPNEYDRVPRATKLKLKAWNAQGQPYELEAEGLLAHCIQHEVDHLNAILYIDKLHPLAIMPRYQAVFSAIDQANNLILKEKLSWIIQDAQKLFAMTTKMLQQKLMPFQSSFQEILKPQHPELKKALELYKVFHQFLLVLSQRPDHAESQLYQRICDRLLEQCKDNESFICKKIFEIVNQTPH